jgi:phenylacetic acid degradation operon negative regulatory protein
MTTEQAPVRDQRSLRSGSTSQGLLLTLIGDYWFGHAAYIPSAALVALLAEFDISGQAARAALSRVQRAGYLQGERQGRRTMYRLSPESANRAVASGRRIMRFTAERPATSAPWDGTWTLVTYALQTEQVDERRQLRRQLRALGFGGLQDGVWISPRVTAAQVNRALGDELEVDLVIFEEAALAECSALEVNRIWSLDEIAERYQGIVGQLKAMLPKVRGRRGPSPAEALVMRTEAMQEWRMMPLVDPRLPVELLPERWPGWQARELFTEVYDRLGDLAVERVHELVAPHSVEAADAVHHDSVARPR